MELNVERDKKVFELMKQIYELTDADVAVIQSGCQEWTYYSNTNEGRYLYYDGLTSYHYDIKV